eukprot:SAG31_NODE_2334_length_5929_cov_1.453516_2_plen_304_part_00
MLNADLERQVIELLLRPMYDSVDKNGDGIVTIAEVVKAARQDPVIRELIAMPHVLGGESWVALLSPEDENDDYIEDGLVKTVFRSIDTDGDGMISFEEFQTAVLETLGHRTQDGDPLAREQAAAREYDRENRADTTFDLDDDDSDSAPVDNITGFLQQWQNAGQDANTVTERRRSIDPADASNLSEFSKTKLDGNAEFGVESKQQHAIAEPERSSNDLASQPTTAPVGIDGLIRALVRPLFTSIDQSNDGKLSKAKFIKALRKVLTCTPSRSLRDLPFLSVLFACVSCPVYSALNISSRGCLE